MRLANDVDRPGPLPTERSPRRWLSLRRAASQPPDTSNHSLGPPWQRQAKSDQLVASRILVTVKPSAWVYRGSVNGDPTFAQGLRVSGVVSVVRYFAGLIWVPVR